ncbi:MAG: SUMF1/EgtB/PvdO family nonheme iron enzyme [Bacteroidota bacterium]
MRSILLIILLWFSMISFLHGQDFPTETVQLPDTDISFDLVQLPGGNFRLGSQTEDVEVELSPFWIGTHEVTHDLYRLFQVRANDNETAAREDFSVDAISRPSPPYLDLTYGMGMRGGFPQVNTTQQAALRFCQWLYQKTGQFYRLPTEAEWEYACLAGSEVGLPQVQAGTSIRPEDLEEYAWLYENSGEVYHPTGQKAPNAFGLYDMLGNVSEWTLDHYTADYYDYLRENPVDPWVVPSRKHSRTVRGGSYDSYQEECSCRLRIKSSARWQARDPQIPKSIWWNVDAPFVGFRLVRPVDQPSEAEIEAFFATAIVD